MPKQPVQPNKWGSDEPAITDSIEYVRRGARKTSDTVQVHINGMLQQLVEAGVLAAEDLDEAAETLNDSTVRLATLVRLEVIETGLGAAAIVRDGRLPEPLPQHVDRARDATIGIQ